MSFFSTRGENCVTASQAILQGIAPDGGLYVPAMFPPVSLSKISEMADMDYISRAVNVLKLFLEDFTIPEIEQAVKAAYGGDRFNLTNIKAFGGYPNAVIAFYAFLTCSTRAVKAAGSEIAISDSTLRFRVIPAFFKPFMKVE